MFNRNRNSYNPNETDIYSTQLLHNTHRRSKLFKALCRAKLKTRVNLPLETDTAKYIKNTATESP